RQADDAALPAAGLGIALPDDVDGSHSRVDAGLHAAAHRLTHGLALIVGDLDDPARGPIGEPRLGRRIAGIEADYELAAFASANRLHIGDGPVAAGDVRVFDGPVESLVGVGIEVQRAQCAFDVTLPEAVGDTLDLGAVADLVDGLHEGA